jgi:hypothetical protein
MLGASGGSTRNSSEFSKGNVEGKFYHFGFFLYGAAEFERNLQTTLMIFVSATRWAKSATMAWQETVTFRPVARMVYVKLDDETHPPSGEVAMRDPFSRTSRPSNTHVIRATGLLLVVEHSNDTVSFTLASLGPVTVTVFGPTTGRWNGSTHFLKRILDNVK